MKTKATLHSVLVSLSLISSPAMAQEFPPRPVVEASLQAAPGKRLEAVQFVRASYPGISKDIYSQLKADFPQLEHGLVDAALKTWQQHPGEILAIAEEVKSRFGPRLQALRQAVHLEMEESYPNYRQRLNKVLEQYGPASRWHRFMEDYNPSLLGEAQSQVKEEIPEARSWYPGKFRALWAQSEPGSSPVFDRLRELAARYPEAAPRLATRLVSLSRQSSPSLAEDVSKHFLDNSGQLAEALRSEFPGAELRIIEVVQKTDSELHNEVASFVRERMKPLRKDFRSHLESELPGFEQRLSDTVTRRYPQLQEQVLEILRS